MKSPFSQNNSKKNKTENYFHTAVGRTKQSGKDISYLKIKCWKQSENDELWYYIPHKDIDKTPTNPAKETLNAVKFGTKYRIYHTEGHHNIKLVGEVDNREEAQNFMIKYMREHDNQ